MNGRLPLSGEGQMVPSAIYADGELWKEFAEDEGAKSGILHFNLWRAENPVIEKRAAKVRAE